MNFPFGPYLEVLNFIRKYPEGCTADQIAEAFPDLSPSTRGGITCRLRMYGYVARIYEKGRVTLWVAIR